LLNITLHRTVLLHLS